MHATFRRIKTNPGGVGDVAALIQAEYLPLVSGIGGFVSYTLIDLGDDEVGSVGVFTSASSADAANQAAQAWTAQRLAPYVVSPLDVRAGPVLIDTGSDTAG